jgi:uncharacterized protein YndB with AHSA1/START domain
METELGDFKQKAHPKDLRLVRVLKAPRSLVFDAWVQPEQFTSWFGPRGSSMPFCQMEARSGGSLHFLHRLDDGQEIWVKGNYEEVLKPERLVFTVHFSDKAGNRVERPGFSMETRIEVTFREKGVQTEITIHQTGLVADQGESEGWKQGLDRLAEILLKTS